MTVVQFLKTKSVDDNLEILFKEFARMHCEAQAEAIANISYSDWVEDPKKAIKEAYPLTNIK